MQRRICFLVCALLVMLFVVSQPVNAATVTGKGTYTTTSSNFPFPPLVKGKVYTISLDVKPILSNTRKYPYTVTCRLKTKILGITHTELTVKGTSPEVIPNKDGTWPPPKSIPFRTISISQSSTLVPVTYWWEIDGSAQTLGLHETYKTTSFTVPAKF